MTVVDSRGRRVPSSVRGREFSGPAAERPRRDPDTSVGPRPGGGYRPAHRPAGSRQPTASTSRRPGSLPVWVLATLGTLVGVAIGASQHDATGRATLIAYVIAAPVAAGLVRRGRSLRQLILCLPLALVLAVAVASAVALHQGGTPLTPKGIVEELAQVLVLHSPWLWGGTLLAVLVGLRRGLASRRRLSQRV